MRKRCKRQQTGTSECVPRFKVPKFTDRGAEIGPKMYKKKKFFLKLYARLMEI